VSLIRMRSLVQIQVGPHPESPYLRGFRRFRTPEISAQMGTAVKRAVKHAKHLLNQRPSKATFRRLPTPLDC
jgi:hypothetical protein